MSWFEHIPLVRFIKIARRSGGIQFSKLHHLAPWLLKYTLFEPLRITESILFNHRVRNHQISQEPVFLLGFYRTGTTYLQRLFVQNKNLGYQTVFHSALPELSFGFKWLLLPILSVITRLLRIRNDFHKIRFTWDFPGEEDVAMAGFTFYESPNWGNLFPKSFLSFYEDYAWFSGADITAQKWKARYLFFVKKLSLCNRGKRLVLKSPPNTARVETLLELFPNAKFVCIHRNPFHVYASCQRFWVITNRHYAFQRISGSEINKIILHSFDRTMNIYHSMKNLIPSGNLHEITYESLAAQPFTRFKDLYSRLALHDFDRMEENIKRYIIKTSNYPVAAYKLTAEEKQRVEQHWRFHIHYWQQLREQGL